MKFAIFQDIFIDSGLKLENGILKEVGSNEAMFLLAGLPSHSPECLYN